MSTACFVSYETPRPSGVGAIREHVRPSPHPKTAPGLPESPLVQALFLDWKINRRDIFAAHRPVAQGLSLRAHLAACDLLHLAQAPPRPLQTVKSMFRL